MRWPKGLDGLCHGGDYNPEQWPEQVWAEDLTLMRQARVNLVTVGVFAWSRLEPAPGRYTFDWLDRILDLLHGGGVRVALATPTASPPPWFSLAHPDALPVTADGVRLTHGSRDTYCPSAPAYRTAALRIAGALAERYRDHPALAMWHVHNEYSAVCHCAYSIAAFRRWLRGRYGDLDALNDAWTTSFWSQHYTDWGQIGTPRATGYLHNPSQALDFRRFCSDELLAAFTDQRDLLRAATPDVPVTTNYVQGGWVSVDHARWSSEVDLVAIDHYPSVTDSGAEEQTAFAADLARSWARLAPSPAGAIAGAGAGAGGGPAWLLMESAPNLIITPGRLHAKEPGRMARHSLSHVARGSRGALYFQWRAPRGGAELYHSALVPHAGPDSRVFREAVAFGETLERLAEIDASAVEAGVAEASAVGASAGAGVVEAGVAIGWDAGSWWALQSPSMPSASLDYQDEVAAAHRALWRAGFGTDFVNLDADLAAGGEPLAAYRLVVLPAHYLVRDAVAEVVRGFVAAGGHLVVTYLSGVADEYARVRTGGYPGAFRDLLGVRVEEFHPLAAGETLPLVDRLPLAGAAPGAAGPADAAGGAAADVPGPTGRIWSETVRLAGAQPVAAYAAGALAGQPVVTRHGYGAGTAWYVSTRLDDASYQRLLAHAAEAAGVAPVCPGAPAGVEAVRRRAGERSWLFLLNHTDGAVRVPASGTDLLSGVRVSPAVTVPAGGFVVVREEP